VAEVEQDIIQEILQVLEDQEEEVLVADSLMVQ
jgi:hypothetical protein